jgi:hypothetical protein
MFGDKQIKTVSDAGGVLVYSSDFSVLVPNGAGDGITRIAVFHRGDNFDSRIMIFSGSLLDGRFSVSGYDCSKEPAAELSGQFWVYYYDGFVAFVEC